MNRISLTTNHSHLRKKNNSRNVWTPCYKTENLLMLYHGPLLIYLSRPIPRYPRHRENRENGQKKSLSGKTQGIWKYCQNTGNLVFPLGKFPDSKGKRYFDISRENFKTFLSLPNQFCICNCHKSRKLAQGKFVVGHGKHREFENAI